MLRATQQVLMSKGMENSFRIKGGRGPKFHFQKIYIYPIVGMQQSSLLVYDRRIWLRILQQWLLLL